MIYVEFPRKIIIFSIFSLHSQPASKWDTIQNIRTITSKGIDTSTNCPDVERLLCTSRVRIVKVNPNKKIIQKGKAKYFAMGRANGIFVLILLPTKCYGVPNFVSLLHTLTMAISPRPSIKDKIGF
ncbi:10404_t:CDS:2 [Rhizophagus irregularis]|nr:10404_t:CDS:2 [Rhizophagus irregularis]